jgi:hypothetical protein
VNLFSEEVDRYNYLRIVGCWSSCWACGVKERQRSSESLRSTAKNLDALSIIQLLGIFTTTIAICC